MDDLIRHELENRRGMWERLCEKGGPKGVSPSLLRELGIYGGAQGVWVDKERTSRLTEDRTGVTVGLLHTGSSYADDLSDDGVLYHYPDTNRATGRDAAEVAATKAAGRLGLPVFVISYPSPASVKRDVHWAWVEAWDDEARIFLIAFANERPPLISPSGEDEEPFVLFGDPNTARRTATARRGQERFKFRVFQRYGPHCAVCGFCILELLETAHIAAKKERGSDDPRNGLVLCANHHRAFDANLFAIEPQELRLQFRPGGPGAVELKIAYQSLSHLRRKPHQDALEWRWRRWKEKTSATGEVSA